MNPWTAIRYPAASKEAETQAMLAQLRSNDADLAEGKIDSDTWAARFWLIFAEFGYTQHLIDWLADSDKAASPISGGNGQ